jgi:hypothetical protein
VKMRQLMAVIIAALGAAMLPLAAHADSVLYAGAGFLRGTQSFTDTFDLPSAGTLTVTLSNIAWPEQLASLNLLLSSSSGMLGPEMGAGTSTFSIAAGGNVTAQWFGTAQGALDAGVYSMVIAFQPEVGTPVPLPASIVLLFSGLCLLLWKRRVHAL